MRYRVQFYPYLDLFFYEETCLVKVKIAVNLTMIFTELTICG
jgi:hypothetical protein